MVVFILKIMNLFVYSDESGVFDNKHDEYFIFGGVIFLSKEERDNAERLYKNVERNIEISNNIKGELKASSLNSKCKNRLYKTLKRYYRFATIIKTNDVYKDIFKEKKSKQRFLDYAYKRGLKNALEKLIDKNIINPSDVENIYVYCDQHTTATNGIYELGESLISEFKIGVYNSNFTNKIPPLFTKIKSVKVEYCDTKNKALIRYADIVSNFTYYKVNKNLPFNDNIFIKRLP